MTSSPSANGSSDMHTSRTPGREASFGGDLRYMLGILRAKAWIVLLCLLAAVGIGATYAWTSPKIYAAKATLQIEQQEQNVVKIEGVKTEDLKAPEVLKTYEQNILSPDVLLRVINHPDLAKDPAFLPEVKSPRSDNALQAALARRITAKIRRDSRLIDITVEDPRPALARRITGLLIQEFILWNSEARRAAAQTANRFLHERASDLGNRLEKSEHALQAYKELHGDVSLRARPAGSPESTDRLNQRITEAHAEYLRLASDAAQLVTKSRHSTEELLTFPSIASAPAIVDLARKVGEKETAIAPLRQRYKDGHPARAAAETELEGLRASLASAANQTTKQLDTRLRELRLTEENLKQALRDQQKVSLGEDAVTIGYAALTREVEANRTMYESVLKRVKETDVTKELAGEVVQVVARPLLPDLPVKPRKSVILLLSLLAGLGAGSFIAFASHAADGSLQTLEDAEARLGLRSLGEIPRLAGANGKMGNAAGGVASDLAVVESFSTLGTSLSLLDEGAGRKVILFTSAHAGEGKTFCAINCAASFARLGLKTLLIDADFRLPGIERILLGTEEAPGMSDLLLGQSDREQAIHPTRIDSLSVLPAGRRVARPAECFSRPELQAVIEQLARDFDRVVIDTAPIHLVSDTLRFVKHVHYVCLVIHAARTPAEDVLRTAHRLAAAGAPLMGFVWNQVKPQKSYHQYYERTKATRGDGRLLH